MPNWTVGDSSGSETLTDADSLYPGHVNELRNYIDDKILAGGKIVNVLDYGAVADGTTDNSTAFASAITAAGVNGTILIPSSANPYMLAEETAINANVAGQRFVGSGYGSQIETAQSTSGSEVFVVTADDVEICHLFLHGYQLGTRPTGDFVTGGNGSASYTGFIVYVDEADRVKVHDVWCRNGQGAIWYEDSDYGAVDRVRVDNTDEGISFINCSNFNVSNCIIKRYDNGTYGGYIKRGLNYHWTQYANTTNVYIEDVQSTGVFVRTQGDTDPDHTDKQSLISNNFENINIYQTPGCPYNCSAITLDGQDDDANGYEFKNVNFNNINANVAGAGINISIEGNTDMENISFSNTTVDLGSDNYALRIAGNGANGACSLDNFKFSNCLFIGDDQATRILKGGSPPTSGEIAFDNCVFIFDDDGTQWSSAFEMERGTVFANNCVFKTKNSPTNSRPLQIRGGTFIGSNCYVASNDVNDMEISPTVDDLVAILHNFKLKKGSISTGTVTGNDGTVYYTGQWDGFVRENQGTASFSGNGVTTAFEITHGLTYTPQTVSVIPSSAAAGTAEIDYVAVSSTKITVNFKAAPANGTNNARVFWKATYDKVTLV